MIRTAEHSDPQVRDYSSVGKRDLNREVTVLPGLRSYSLSSSLGSHSVPWLDEGLSVPSPNYPVLCFPLPYRVAPVFVQVVSPPLGWSPLSSFIVVWSPSSDM